MTRLLIMGFAAWRISSLLIREDGPGDVFARLRHRLEVDKPGEMTQLAVLFSCMWCMSMWVAAGVVLLSNMFDRNQKWLTIPAVSAIAIAVDDRIRRTPGT